MKTILKRKDEPLFSFDGPNSHVNKFALIEQRRFWFNRIIKESHSLEEVKNYARVNNIQFEDHTLKQLQLNSARPVKVN